MIMNSIAKHYPHIICHMMSTIDGKITSGDGVDILDNYFDIYTKTEDMLEPHSAWMCGRVTMQMFSAKNDEFIQSQSTSSQYLFGVDTKGVLRWGSNTIKLSNIESPLHLVIVVTESTPKEYIQYLNDKNILSVLAGEDEIDFKKLFEIMSDKFGVKTLLLEGGGILNGSIMAADLVDEISLLVTPIVLNNNSAPSVFDRKISDTIDCKNYSLKDVKQMDKDCVWLRYNKK